MADTMQFDLVSPERKLASVEATMVELPGMDGDMAALPNHTPVLTTLRPGLVKVHAAGGVTEYVVTGGFAEIAETGTSVLAETAMAKGDVTREALDQLVTEASEASEAGDELSKTVSRQRVNDLGTLISDLGL